MPSVELAPPAYAVLFMHCLKHPQRTLNGQESPPRTIPTRCFASRRDLERDRLLALVETLAARDADGQL